MVAGRPLSYETKRKISESSKKAINSGRFKKGVPKLNSRGEKHYNWKGGITSNNRIIRHSMLMEQWRSDVFERDNWTCQTCGKRGRDLEAHHIKEFHLIIKENNINTFKQAENCPELWDINNGATLCVFCHNLTKNKIIRSS